MCASGSKRETRIGEYADGQIEGNVDTDRLSHGRSNRGRDIGDRCGAGCCPGDAVVIGHHQGDRIGGPTWEIIGIGMSRCDGPGTTRLGDHSRRGGPIPPVHCRGVGIARIRVGECGHIGQRLTLMTGEVRRGGDDGDMVDD